jgi:small conductance mechanosensitive channel
MDNIGIDPDSIKTLLTTTVAAVALKIPAALAFWLIGRWLIGRITAGMRAAMNRSAVDPMLVKYLGSVVGVILNIALVIGILGYFGIETTSFAALLAGAGLAIGAAWSEMLGNFAAGA